MPGEATRDHLQEESSQRTVPGGAVRDLAAEDGGDRSRDGRVQHGEVSSEVEETIGQKGTREEDALKREQRNLEGLQ